MSNNQTSHKQILKATGLLGGAQVIEILVKIARNKIIAVLLGPAGVGMIGLYQSTIDLMRSATGFGLQFSAVRDIAEAAGSQDKERISRAKLILQRWVWFTGLLGMVVMLVFSKPLSHYAFGDDSYASGIAVLSLVLLLDAQTGGQLALLQGLRKIRSMAQAKVWGVLLGFCITVPLYWFLGQNGIVPALVMTAVISLFLAWFYSRKIDVEQVDVTLSETAHGGLRMVRLGFFLVLAGFSNMAAMYILRVFISHKSDLNGVGQFQAAWNLSAVYLAAVLQAMATDYFPRLSAVNKDNTQLNRLVNEQTEIALLVAGPLIVAMLSFMSLVVMLLYSSEFTETVKILHWQLAGTFLKVLTWPIGFIILAKGWGGIFIFNEISSKVFLITPVVLFWGEFGLEITGIAYMFSFVCGLVILIVITKRLCGFFWTRESLKQILIFGVLTLIAFLNSKYVQGTISYLTGGLLTMCAAGYSYLELRKIVDLRSVINKFLKR